MKDAHRSLVKRRLVLINAVIVITSIVGLLSILEVARGVGFHESNIQHLGLTSQLTEKISRLEGHSSAELAEVRQLLLEIRKEPESCLASRNPVMEFGLRVLNTQQLYAICETDIEVIEEALALIPVYEQGQISQQEFLAQFKEFADIMHNHSFEFRPLVSRTVDVLLIIAGVILALKGLAVALISILSSRSIMSQFQSISIMEQELRVNNSKLNDSIDVLEAQKQQLADAQKKAEYNALHDTLTSLPNRRYLDAYLLESEYSESTLAILHIDIDGFKHINDTRGHKAGDFVLQAVAERLICVADKTGFVGRVGGDEFVLVMKIDSEKDSARITEKVAAQLVAELKRPVNFERFDCRLSASVGVAISRGHTPKDNDASTLLANADMALYDRKLNGKDGYSFYDDALRKAMTEKKKTADEIHEALKTGGFVPFFQAQVLSDSFHVSGVEALVRWQHPERGLLTPDKFLSVAEEMGVMGDLDRLVFEKAYQCFTDWESMGLDVPRLSVNMSLNRLMDTSLQQHLDDYDLSHERVSFELIESILLDGCDEEMHTALINLKNRGIQLELDDFGSGHASILGLLELMPTRLKIDRQFVGGINDSDAQTALVRSIIEIGKSVGVEVIAEGVETLEQAILMRDLGCHSLQGYYFSKPVCNQDFVEWMKRQSIKQAA